MCQIHSIPTLPPQPHALSAPFPEDASPTLYIYPQTQPPTPNATLFFIFQADGADGGGYEHVVRREDGREGPELEEIGRLPSSASFDLAPVEQLGPAGAAV